LLTGQPGPIREVMDRLRNVPVVPPMDSLRHIGLALVKQGATSATMAPIGTSINSEINYEFNNKLCRKIFAKGHTRAGHGFVRLFSVPFGT